MRKTTFASMIGLFALASVFLMQTSESGRADDPKEVAVANDSAEQLLEAVGTMGSVQLYQTYLNIGFIADGKGQQLYSDEDAQDLLASVVGPLEIVARQLTTAKRVATDNDDKKALDRLATIGVLLKTQGANLATYWETGADDDHDRYEKTRQRAWSEISDLLGLKEAPRTPELAPLPKKVGG